MEKSHHQSTFAFGLSDTKFQTDLRKSEIDHDFFDNPCEEGEEATHYSGTSNSNSSNNVQEQGKEKDDEALFSSLSKNKKIEGEGDHDGDDEEDEGCQFNLDLDIGGRVTQPQPIIRLGSGSGGRISHVAPYGFQQRRDVDDIDSGPHSSYFNLLDEHESTSENQNQPAQPVVQVQGNGRQRLFDLSSSSSSSDSSSSDSDSDSDGGLNQRGRRGGRRVDEEDDVALDTEDEEFVELLEKYYDFMDLEDDSGSDLTEVSPMSSFTRSPMPQQERGVVDGEGKDDDEDHNLLPLPTPEIRRQLLPSDKPLPPLIIHTVEDVPIIRAKPGGGAFSKRFHNGLDNNEEEEGNSSSGPYKGSLLMKALPSILKKDGGTGELETEGNNLKASSCSSMSTSTSSLSLPAKSDLEDDSFIPTTATPTTTTTTRSSKVRDQDTGIGASSSLSLSNSKGSSSMSSTFSTSSPSKQQQQKGRKSVGSFDKDKDHHHVLKSSIQHHRFGYYPHHYPPSVKASATIARQRQQRRIEHENSLLIKRLQSVKPSKEIMEAFRVG